MSCLAIAQCNFTLESFSTLQLRNYQLLPLHIGDRVNIIASHDEWCWGNIVGEETICGIFPRLAVVFVSEQAAFAPTEATELIKEITEVLKEWWISIKETYGKQARMESQDEILLYIEELMVMRKKVLSGNFTVDELKEMRLQLVKKIDLGNQWLGLDMVIRDEVGRVIERGAASVAHAYRAHLRAAERILNDSKPNDMNTVTEFSLFIQVNSVLVDTKAKCEFSLMLYDLTEQRFISETFIFRTEPDTSALAPENCRALFKDLGSKEFPSVPPSSKDHRLFLCVKVARIAPIEPSSSTLRKQIDPGPPQLFSRQPYAASVLELTDLLAGFSGPKGYMIKLSRETTLEQLLSKICSASWSNSLKPVNNDSTSEFGPSKLSISAEFLVGSLHHIKKSFPRIFSLDPPVELRKMSFADVISADEVRNDLYVTLIQADLHGGKTSDANIEARVTAVDTNGVIKDCIEFITANGVVKRTSYHSLVFYHDDRPKWNEIVKVVIPEESQQDIHLRITFHHKKSYDKAKPEKGPFAIAFARILEDATLIRDDLHDLLVYRIESGKFNESDTSYLRLPSTRNELRASSQYRSQISPFVYAEKNSVVIRSVTCSTTLTHNKNLLDILRWKTNATSLKDKLEAISCPKGAAVGEELVKFIPTFCDALFDIVDHYPRFDGLVFNALVAVTQFVNEERFKNFRPVLQKYIENFHSTIAFVKLIPVLRQRLESAKETHELTLNTMKSLGVIMQLIVRSKICSDRLRLTSTNFHQLICDLLDSFVNFMRNERVLMTCQNMALKHIPAIIPHLSLPGVFDAERLTDFLVCLLDNLGNNISLRCRLNFIKDVVNSDQFLDKVSRETILPKVLEKIVDELENIDFEKARETPAERSKIEECANASADIVFDILERLFPSASSNGEVGTEMELYYIISKSLRTVLQTTAILINEKIASSAFCALTIAFLSKMSAQMYKNYVDDFQTRIDKHDFLMEMVHLFRDLINKSSFPSAWFHMFCLQNKMVLKTMKFVMSTMVEYFHADNFDAELWREYMLTMVAFSTQKGLQIGSSAISLKRSHILCSQPDLREKAASDLRSMWFRLSMANKNFYIPSMIGSFLQVALIDDDVVRETIIPIFFDMMQWEFLSKPLRDFSKFANEMVVQLDCLVDEDRGDQRFREQLRRIMMDMCSSDSELRKEGCKFVIILDTLLQHLFEYREVRTSGFSIENGMSRTVELLNYYNKIGQSDLYINYVYKLYDLHMLSNNKVEAAFTLLKHAKTLSWTDTELRPALLNAHLNRHCGKQRQLKEALYEEMANLFDEKEMWEESIAIIKELVTEYDKSYEYAKLSELLRRLAELYHKVNSQARVSCTYYLVGYFGLGFPSYLNGQQFVYRGNECEAISTFQSRMLSTFSGSELVTSMDDCSHLIAAEGKHLQIFPVQPISEESFDKKNINRLILWYYKHNRVRKFEYRKGEFRKGTKWTDLENTEIMKSWVIRRYVVINESLPNILKWSQVLSHSDPIECSPLVEAVTTMQKNNDELEELAHLVLSTPLESVVPLGGKIRGVVQAFVQGGIKNYKIFFTEECDAVLTAEEKEIVQQLKLLIKEQIPILEFALYVHASREHQIDAQFHDSLVNSFLEYKHSIEDLFGPIPGKLPPGYSINLRSSQPVNVDRRTASLDATSSPSVSSITSVFRRGGQYTTKSGRSTPRKSIGFRADLKNAFENSVAKRISTASDKSLESFFANSIAAANSRSTCDFSQRESLPRTPTLTGGEIINLRLSNSKRSTELPYPPPLPPRSQLLCDDEKLSNGVKHG